MPISMPTLPTALAVAQTAHASHALHAVLPQRKRISSLDLLANEREIEIEHAGQLYRLRLTSLGKLILTK